jgi:hypothetical protein
MFSMQRTREIRNSCAALFIEQGQTFLSSHFSFRSLSLFFPFSMHSVKQSAFLSQRRLLDRLYIKHDNSESQKILWEKGRSINIRFYYKSSTQSHNELNVKSIPYLFLFSIKFFLRFLSSKQTSNSKLSVQRNLLINMKVYD